MAVTKDSPHPNPLHRRSGCNPLKDGAPQTLLSSPTRSFSSSPASSSDFEFTVVLSPRKSTSSLCPADELFYKGQLLPLQLSPRISMVHTLLLSASSCSSSDASRESTGSSTDSLFLDSSCSDSSHPSSVTTDHPEYNDLAKLTNDPNNKGNDNGAYCDWPGKYKTGHGYFGLSKFSSVFLRKEIKHQQRRETVEPGLVKRMSVTSKEVIGKYLKKVKPIYEKLSSQKQHRQQHTKNMGFPSCKTGVVHVLPSRGERAVREILFDAENGGKSAQSIVKPFSHSVSGNLRYPRKRSSGMSCPSSMPSSPSRSGERVGDRLGFMTGHSPFRRVIDGGVAEPDTAARSLVIRTPCCRTKVGNNDRRLD